MALTDKLSAIGNAIREKTGETDLLTLDAMPTAIQSISGGGYTPTDAELTFSGISSYSFYNGKYDWVLKNYGNRIKTSNLSNLSYMFYYTKVYSIPFSLNLQTNRYTSVYLNNVFQYSLFKTPPTITGGGGEFNGCKEMFSSCKLLRRFPDDYFNFVDNFNYIYQYASCDYFFSYNNLLEDIPSSFNKIIDKSNLLQSFYSTIYNNCFNQCYKLRKIENLSALDVTNKSTNMFDNCFYKTYSLRKMTFKSNLIRNWSKQIIDLSTAGYGSLGATIGMEEAPHKVNNDEEYQNNKQYDDWWSDNVKYACYNKISAVETINSLPDTSAYLATAGGTNTIKFKGEAGSATDGGAINTMTEEEIAVATAKGWTVSFV